MPQSPPDASQRFYELIWPCRADVLRMARILCGNLADAEDLAQETLLKAFSGIQSFRTGTDARAWLMRILRNARIDRLRSTARESASISLGASDVDVPDSGPSELLEDWNGEPEQILNAFSDQQVIDSLKTLPEEIRMTLLLVDIQQLDHKEAAEILEVPVGTIKSRTHRGRRMLREALLPLARDLKLAKQS